MGKPKQPCTCVALKTAAAMVVGGEVEDLSKPILNQKKDLAFRAEFYSDMRFQGLQVLV